MKIWKSYGTEHSMNLVMIGTFKSEKDAREVGKIMERLREDLPNHIDYDDGCRRFDEGLIKILEKARCSILNRHELEQFLYEFSLSREGNTLRLWTDETEISAFMKIMYNRGARIEIFSAHDYPERTSEDD